MNNLVGSSEDVGGEILHVRLSVVVSDISRLC